MFCLLADSKRGFVSVRQRNRLQHRLHIAFKIVTAAVSGAVNQRIDRFQMPLDRLRKQRQIRCNFKLMRVQTFDNIIAILLLGR